ncbi:hypothetical protein [Nocardia sp. NPDC058705]|uniref:hypothetical protein n=1 Tax=Nocardia sp. NPDC058705 TaxID=3346609 RepID=UPI00369438AD
MSGEDSKQLSVAELLARNAAQGAAPAASGGGGRRRRSGRGVSVNDLTGENAAVKPNSHAAPAPEPPPAYVPAPTYAPEPTYEAPASYQPAPYPPPGPAEPAFSPMSGPITRFDPDAGNSDPLGLAEQRPTSDPFGPFRAEARDTTSRGGRVPGRLGVPGGPAQPVDPGIAEMFGSGALPAVGGGRRHRPEEPEAAAFAEPPKPPPVTGGRAARRRAAEAAEEAVEPSPAPRPSFDAPLYEAGIDAPQAFMGRPGQSRGLADLPEIGPGFGDQPGYSEPSFDTRPAPGFNGRPGESFDGRPATGFNGRHGESFDGQPVDGRQGPDSARGFNGAGRNGAPGFNAPGRGESSPGQPAPGRGDAAPGLNAPGRGDAASGFNGQFAPGRGDAASGLNGGRGDATSNGYSPNAEATQAYNLAPGVDAPPARGADQRPSLDRRRGQPKSGGLPSWSARRHRPDKTAPAPESDGFPTAAWSPVSQEQPLVAGQSVAGDLLRQRADRGPEVDARTEVHHLGVSQADDEDTDDYAESDYVDRDYVDNDYSDADYAESEYDDAAFDDEYDDDYEPKPTRAGRRAATKAAASKLTSRAKSKMSRRADAKPGSRAESKATGRAGAKPASLAESRAASRKAGNRAGGSMAGRAARVSSMARGDDDNANRRQWMILGAQSVGAAIAGMLLFKGFETLWESMALVALALATVVILGLVALVRILRRTDDIFSTVIAVVVGVFVTLGPLAFLLSTS